MADDAQNARAAAMKNVRFFAIVPGLIVAIIVAILAVSPPNFAHASQAEILRPSVVLSILLLALLGVYISIRTGMTADPLAVALRRQALFHAVGGGVLLGLLTVATDYVSGFSSAVANTLQIASIHIGFPESAYVYAVGGTIVECVYRFIPVSILYGLMFKWMHGRHEAALFWMLGTLAALIEPMSQAPLAGQAACLFAPLFGLIFMFNLAEVWLWRRYGWVAPVVSRLSFYGIWHVAVGPVLTGTI
jgi:hypothetical protein